MVLVNGAEGIGSGWSTFIPNYNPRELVEIVKNKLNSIDIIEIHPFYKNFKGDIIQDGKGGYFLDGIVEIDEER